MRLFAAVELPDEAKRRLAAAAAPLPALVPGLRLSDPATWHVTVRFLGDTGERDLPRLREALARGAAGAPAGVAALAAFGAFPSWRRPSVVWAGLGGPSGAGTLAALARSVSAEFLEAGFGKPDRPFRAHVTVGRVRADALRRAGGASAAEGQSRAAPGGIPSVPPASVPVRELVLFESRLLPGGARHAVLDRFPLASSPA